MGAVARGLVGYFGFLWIDRQSFYALVLPGGLLGVGASLFTNRSTALCIISGALALALGVLAEWQFSPFITDGSLGYFVTHIHKLKPITLIMLRPGRSLAFGHRSAVVKLKAEVKKPRHAYIRGALKRR